MRRFSIDAPSLYCFQVGETDEVYKIPLMGSMNVAEAKEFENTGGDLFEQVEWLRGYVGDIVDVIPVGTIAEIVREWAAESRTQGATVGESSALSE